MTLLGGVRVNVPPGTVGVLASPSGVHPRAVRAIKVVEERPARLIRMCPYCGHGCVGPACRQHRDLLRLDPSSPLAVSEASR